MSQDQTTVILILAATIGLFLWGRWRHDMVAAGALLACVATGLTPAAEAFSGFSHPAVITVACVLIMSHGLQTSGAVAILAQPLQNRSAGVMATIGTLSLLAAVLSAFMNNVGALALLMPIGIKAARELDIPPGRLLMPLSFSSILGGMTTLIGTPPNLIVSGFRNSAGGNSFAMFDFTPVGLVVAATGLAFIALIGWRLVPGRAGTGREEFETAAYLTEVMVTAESRLNDSLVRDAEGMLDSVNAQMIALVHNDVRIPVPHPLRKLRENDILVIEAEPKELGSTLAKLNLKLIASPKDDSGEQEKAPKEAAAESRDEETAIIELAVLPDSRLAGHSSVSMRLREHYGVNLLAVSRQGRRSVARLRRMNLKAGDLLLVQGREEAIQDFSAEFGCVPLAARALSIPDRKKAILAMAIMALVIAGASLGLTFAAVSFAGGVLAMLVFGVIRRREVYRAIDWPVIVLLGALIPAAVALAETGAADVIARFLMEEIAQGHAVAALAIILIVTMTLSDFMNNAATAAVMCPIAISAATGLGVSTDPFLMAVAVGASCAFLTPIGHQNNTLILGPGRLRFGDYWRLGLPVEIIVVVTGVPLILAIWPL